MVTFSKAKGERERERGSNWECDSLQLGINNSLLGIFSQLRDEKKQTYLTVKSSGSLRTGAGVLDTLMVDTRTAMLAWLVSTSVNHCLAVLATEALKFREKTQ